MAPKSSAEDPQPEELEELDVSSSLEGVVNDESDEDDEDDEESPKAWAVRCAISLENVMSATALRSPLRGMIEVMLCIALGLPIRAI